MFKEFKDFAMRGNVLDMAIGIIIGSVRKNRLLAGQRHCYATDRVAAGTCGFLQPVYQSLRATPAIPDSGQSGGCADHQLWCVSPNDFGLRDHRFCHLPAGEAGQPPQETGNARRAGDEILSVLRIRHSDQGHEMRALHICRVGCVAMGIRDSHVLLNNEPRRNR